MTIIKKLALAASVAGIGLAAPAQAAPYTPPTASGTATVRLYSAIQLDKVADLDFGTVIRANSTTSGSVPMNAAGVVDCTLVANVTCTGATSEGHFTIQGDAGAAMTVSMSGATYDASTNELLLTNGTESVSLALQYAGMTQEVVLGVSQPTFTVAGTGAATDIRLYGTLSFGDSTVAPNGLYTADYDLTADYQ